MATKLDELFFEVTVKKGPGTDQAIGAFTVNMKKTEQASKGAAAGVDKYSASTARAGKASAGLNFAIKRLLIAFGGFIILRAVNRALLGFEDRMAEVSTIAGGGAEQVEELRVSILGLTRSIPQSAEELGAGAYQILSAGITETSDVLSVLEASSKAAVAGLTDTETSVNAITTVLNAFSLDASEATRIADVLFKTVELGKLRFTDLAQNLGNAATSAALAGISIEELTAGIAVLTQRGVFAAEATTSLNRLFLTLTSQTDEQKAAFARLGIEFNTATVAEKGFAGVLEEINQLTEGEINSLAELFPNIRAARAAFVLAGSGLESYKETLKATQDAQGASEVAFQKMNQTARNQARILRNNVIATFQEVSTSVLPAVSAAFGFLSEKIRQFIGGIKIIGVEMAVVDNIIRVFTQTAAVQFQAFVAAIVGAIATLAEKLQGILQRAAALPLPGIRELAAVGERALGGIASLARTAETASLNLLRTGQDRLAVERQQLEFMREAAEEMKAQILLETDFVTQRKQRQELAELEAQLAEQTRKITEEEANAQAEAKEELARRVSEAVSTAAELEIEAIKLLREQYLAAFGSIGEEAEAAFAIIEEKAREALSKETAAQLADDFRDALQEGLRAVEIEFLDAGEEERTNVIERQLDVYRDIRAQVEGRLSATEAGSDEEKELQNVLIEIVKLLKQATKEQGKLADEAGKDADQRFKDMQLTVSLIKQASDGVIELASAFGLVNEKTAKLLNNMEQIATGALTLGAGLASGNIGGIISGGVSLLGGVAGAIGGLFGGGDPERERITKENTEAIEDLTKTIGEFGEIDISGEAFANIAAALAPIGEFQGGFAGLFGSLRDFRNNLDRLGLDMKDVQEAADELGIEFKERLKPTFGELRQLAEAIAAVELAQFANTFTGQLEALRAEFEIFDITDPIEQLQRLADVFADPRFGAPALRDALAGLDITTPEGRRQAEENIERLFRALQTGTLTPAQLGGLTPEQFLAALRELEGGLDDIAVSTGETQDVRRAVQITEIQASQLLAFQATNVQLAFDRNALLGSILNVLLGNPITAPALPVTVGGGAGAVYNIQVGPNEFTIGDDPVTEQAGDFVDMIAKDLGERLQSREALFGETI